MNSTINNRRRRFENAPASPTSRSVKNPAMWPNEIWPSAALSWSRPMPSVASQASRSSRKAVKRS
jgi:hypothetical protein